MTEEMIKILKKAATSSTWVNWVLSAENAQETRDFLQVCYKHLTTHERSRWAKRISTGDQRQVAATIHELVAVELVRRLQLAPEYEPSIGKKTPDISFSCSGQRWLADVYLAHTPQTIVQEDGDVVMTIDKGETAQKIEEELAKKARKYSKTGLPLVLFVFVGDYYGNTIESIKEALFGQRYAELEFLKDSVLSSVKQGHLYHPGLFFRELVYLPGITNLSAIVACEWFDTLNRQNPGKRFYCIVNHHWNATCELPLDAFGGFSQVVWNRKGPDVWTWKYTTCEPRVARLPPEGGIELRSYTADNPW